MCKSLILRLPAGGEEEPSNLAMANRSRVSSVHIVATVNSRGGGEFLAGKEAYGTSVLAAAGWQHKFQCGKLFTGGIAFHARKHM